MCHYLPSLPPPQITHPAGCFTQFLQFFGPSVFVLWRLSLLKKKIVLFSPPPIGVVCYRGELDMRVWFREAEPAVGNIRSL